VLHVTERRGQEVDCRVVVLPLKQHWWIGGTVQYYPPLKFFLAS
jgi:hypothetical protein